MKISRFALMASALLVVAGTALAQPAPAASTAGPGMGQGQGQGMGGMRGGGPRFGADNTPGWSLMSRQERQDHRNRMRSMKTEDECRAYQAQHHEQMAARAKEKGITALPGPRRDPCAGLTK